MGLNDRYTKLQCSLVGDTRRATGAARRICTGGRCRGGGTDEMGSVNLNRIGPLGAHFSKSKFRILQQHGILDISKAYTYAGGVRHCMCPDIENV